jgi:hypothetical protein
MDGGRDGSPAQRIGADEQIALRYAAIRKAHTHAIGGW